MKHWIKVTKVDAAYLESVVYLRADMLSMFGSERGINFVVIGTVYVQVVESPAMVLAQLEQSNGNG